MTLILDPPAWWGKIQNIPDISLSSMFPDLFANPITSAQDFSIKDSSGTIILSESYKPFDYSIKIKGLKEILSLHLRRKNQNLIIGGVNTQIMENFTFTLGSDSKQGDVIYSRMKSNIPAAKLKGELFLTTQHLKKVTMPQAKEFLTYFFSGTGITVSAKMYYYRNGQIMNTNYVPIESGKTGFYAFDTSFSRIKSYFPTIATDECLFYRVGNDSYNVEYLIDRSSYPNLTQFVYMNNFGVPDTLFIRGEVIHNVDAKFSEGKVQRVSHKWDLKENETFEASTGKIFNRDEYLMWRDLFMSPDVYIYVNGTPRKVFVTESKNSINRLKGVNKSLTFSFRFAEENDTWDYMRYLEWILEYGVWNDQGIWLDSGRWNDNQL
ncbi:hypothetical protein [Proteiniphilum propionicum]|jgi:hypothetical protein|uniref:hypothetical protein n=1 Tax=Proteiniphilum propionicum TaxID=2829812 RepID=UPI001EEAFA3D|nr:hypothetical protein [Proteiniphilum propionicum]ULB35627.1 hypothetical protein KDN43_06235 [Proteiniphilum propionicum]